MGVHDKTCANQCLLDLHVRLPHISRFFVVELQIFCRGQIGFNFVGTSACRTLADFFVTTNHVGKDACSRDSHVNSSLRYAR